MRCASPRAVDLCTWPPVTKWFPAISLLPSWPKLWNNQGTHWERHGLLKMNRRLVVSQPVEVSIACTSYIVTTVSKIWTPRNETLVKDKEMKLYTLPGFDVQDKVSFCTQTYGLRRIHCEKLGWWIRTVRWLYSSVAFIVLSCHPTDSLMVCLQPFEWSFSVV